MHPARRAATSGAVNDIHVDTGRGSPVRPCPLSDLVYGPDVGGELHFGYLSLGKSDSVEMEGLASGGYGHMLVLVEDVSRVYV